MYGAHETAHAVHAVHVVRYSNEPPLQLVRLKKFCKDDPLTLDEARYPGVH